MLINFDINDFICRHVTNRSTSLLADDFSRYADDLHDKIDGKSVLVIGGAGSIGSHYIKALLAYDVRKLVVVDTNENGLTELVRDLRSDGQYKIPAIFTTYPVSYGDSVFQKILLATGPFDIVANFAAHKHVRSEKDIFSIEAMIQNNVLRARGLLDLLVKNKPEHFFCVSTDKAANPVNIMGASKKLMEEMILAYSRDLPVKTARFANVAFSNGSLLLGFIERLMKRQPWSCPVGIRRFFVSPMESGELCLLASVLGETSDIIFPKLDEERDMIPFDKIAMDLLETLHLDPDICQSEQEARDKMQVLLRNASKDGITRWPIYLFDSDTSGEKAFEEFYTENEMLDMERFCRLGVIKNAGFRKIGELNTIFDELTSLFSRSGYQKNDVVRVLRHYLPNFDHIETGKNLDQKM